MEKGTKRQAYTFAVREYGDGTQYIACEPVGRQWIGLGKGSLSFVLPDNAQVEGIKCVMRSIKLDKRNNSSEVGLQFVQDQAQLDKINNFCRFCMFFEA